MESAEFELKQWLLQLEFLRGDGLWVSEVFLITTITLLIIKKIKGEGKIFPLIRRYYRFPKIRDEKYSSFI